MYLQCTATRFIFCEMTTLQTFERLINAIWFLATFYIVHSDTSVAELASTNLTYHKNTGYVI
jgi:hypothetical protein